MAERCILAVECDWRIRRLIRANLEAAGFEVEEAASGLHAQLVLTQCQPDLVLLDLECSELGDRDLLAVLGAEFALREVPILALSSEAADSHLLREGKVAGYLQKPFAASALLREVWQVLSNRSASV